MNARDYIYIILKFDFQITFGRKRFSPDFDFDCYKGWDDCFFAHTNTYRELLEKIIKMQQSFIGP